jgi:hypothetical protein
MQGQICDILRPQLAMNRFLTLWPHRFPHFEYIYRGGGGVGGGNLFASVDAHLCLSQGGRAQHDFSLAWLEAFTLSSKVAVYGPAEWADTLTLFHL